jgi:protease-4
MAKGTILDGDQPEGTIGGDTLSHILNDLDRDPQIKAVVLRVDSPGGSAFAAEIIRDAIGKITERDIPVVVSMGSYAASGGYWIAAEADSILAMSTTITGSIGVYGMIPTVEDSLAALGIYTDGVGSTDIAGNMRLDRPLSQQTKTLFQASVEHIYDRFVALVANGRSMTPEAVDQIAQGRVWTGQQALELGLVDRLGDLNDAIQVAAELAAIDQYRVEYPGRRLSPQELLIQQLTQNISASLAGLGLQPEWFSTELPTELYARARLALRPLTKLGEFNDPRGIYLHCDSCPI